jgi:YidC/Oxa1 family membrane protein insertase
MSQPAAPRRDFVQILLIAAFVFLGFQLLFPPNPAASDVRPASEVWQQMLNENRDLKDVSIRRTKQVWLSKFEAEAKTKKLSPQQITEGRLRAAMLVADTALKSAKYRDARHRAGKDRTNLAYGKLNFAFDQFKPNYEQFSKTPFWQTELTVVPSAERPQTSVTAESLYNDIVTVMSPIARKEPVFGFIPGYDLIDALVAVTGRAAGFSYTFAAFLLALVVRLAVWPLFKKQSLWGRQMQQLQPMVKEIQAKYTNKQGQVTDQAKMQQEVMSIYQQYGINPLSGCGPMLIQLPFFIGIYQCMLHYRFEFTKGTFLWIQPGATSFLGIPLAPNLGERDYILITIYAISMVVSQWLMPITDPANARQQRILGFVVSVLASVFMFIYPLPAAFVLYWTFANVLATAQSLYAYKLPVPPLVKVATATGGVPVSDAANGTVAPDFFGKTGTTKANKAKKRK